MNKPFFLKNSIKKILSLYENNRISPTDVAQECINTTKKFDPTFFAWEVFSEQQLLKGAKKAVQNIKKKEKLLPLEGIPVGIKDIFNTIDFPTQMGSPLWKNFTPGNDARSVFYIKQAGGIIPGKAVTAEFAVHTLDKTRNPYDITRTPGTSSSGSAVAVATGMVPVALGTQTAGSIVRPASFCGVYGIKPSFGLIPRTGMLKTTDSLDTVGFFVAHAEDIKRVFNVVRVHGLDYPISNEILNDPIRQSKPSNRPWKIAFVTTHVCKNIPKYAQKSLIEWANKISKDLDVEIVETALPPIMENSHDIHATIYNKALAYYFKDEYKQSELVSPIMNNLIEKGNKITVKEYQKALLDQEVLINQMDSFLEQYDAVICLSTAGHAPKREEREADDSGLLWTMTHVPAVSIPAFKSPEGLPFGLQVVARKYNDLRLFKLIDYLESNQLVTQYHFTNEQKKLNA